MRYEYQCDRCGHRQERILSMADHVAVVPCSCGAVARQTFDADITVCIKGGQRDFKLDAVSVPIGWEKGVSGAAQQARYDRKIRATKRLAQQNDKAAIKGGIRHIASVPLELMRSRQNQFGKDYLNPCANSATEIKDQLKSDGLYFHND
jgi:putative FmdB family regulatory protein